MKRVLLIRPGESFVSDVTPPLGLLYLAAVLRERGAEVRVLDLRVQGQSESATADAAAGFGPDLVGYSALSFQTGEVFRLAEAIARRLPATRQVAGGPFASIDPHHVLSCKALDFLVRGEGERTLPALIERLDAGRDPDDVPGLAFRRDGEIAMTAPAEPIDDLDALPFPAFDLADVGAYGRLPRQGFIVKHRRYFAMFTSRGCPYGCTYCHNVFGRRFRFRSAANVLAEIDQLYRAHGVREIQIVDDCFNLKRERVLEICDGIVTGGYRLALAFANGLRGDLLDAEVVDALVRAGTFKVTVAVETASPRLQKEIHKNLNLEKAREAIKLLAERRVMTHGFFMMGFPGETEAELDETARYARTSRLHSASFFHVIPFPGTELYAQLRQAGRSAPDFSFASSYFDPRMSSYSLAAVGPDVLKRKVRSAGRRFYFNPQRLWRIWRDLPNKMQVLFLAYLVLARTLFPGLLGIERRAVERR